MKCEKDRDRVCSANCCGNDEQSVGECTLFYIYITVNLYGHLTNLTNILFYSRLIVIK